MIYKLVLIFILHISLFAQGFVEIHDNKVEIKDFKVDYFIDNSKKIKFPEIKSQTFKQGLNKDSLGVDVTNTWIRIKVKNTSKNKRVLFLHQSTAYLNTKIRYFELDSNGNLLKKTSLSLIDNKSKDEMDGANSIYKFTLESNELKTIYINQETLAYHFYNFTIFSEKESRQYLISEKIDAVLFVGLLLSLGVYNLFIYLSSRYKEYLYYSLYLFSATIWIFYIYGALAHYFNIYGNISYKFNFGLIFIPVFLALFVQTIFNTKEKYPIENKFLNSIIVVLSINFIYALFDFTNALAFIALTLNYALLVFMGISISIYKKGNKIIKIFLYAHTFYLIFNSYSLFFYMGLVEYSYFASHGIGIGIIIEALMLSYLVSYKFKIIEAQKEEERLSKVEAEKEQAKSEVLLLQKSKMADMGEMIGNIAHQWRQPLAIIGISVGILKEKKLLNRLSNKEFEEELSHIELNLSHMSQTIEDFLSYFSPSKKKEEFFIEESVNKALKIIDNSIKKEAITVLLDYENRYSVYGFKEEYIQVLIAILSNAVYALKNQKSSKEIVIKTYTKNNKAILEIIDNAGGIPTDIITKIFDPYFTTKNQSIGTGLGLYISKIIIEKSMQGTLSASNTKNGAKFTISI
ncbi:sensor histidine kinase [Malaciobacter sp. WC5094]